jgi:ATP phosphoribosyltransferase regulatory subunit
MNIIRGFQDVLPEEMTKRRFCENRLRDVFEQWGYQEIETPTLEYYDFLVKGIGPELRKRMFKFLNPDGEIIVLRPDMTTPIARVAATKLGKEAKKLHKFFYLNNVFRKVNNNTEDQQEFHQAGIELLGLNNRLADSEVIAVAIQALINTGLKKFYIDIGSARFFNSIMEQLPLISENKNELRKAIMNKDFVLLERLMLRYNMSREDREIILRLPHWRGDDSVLAEAEQFFKKNNINACLALKEVQEVYQYLKVYGLERHIVIDLGIIRNFDYYSGIVFEGYTEYMGSSICGGGRYDYLCQKFGKDIPSTGVAIGIEKLGMVLSQESNNIKDSLDSRKYFIRYRKELLKSAFKLAERLRGLGCIVELELTIERPLEQTMQYVLDKKIRYLINLQSDNFNEVPQYDLETKLEEKVCYGENKE